DRLFLSQARRLQAVAGLVRACAQGRPEPCADLAVLRSVAARAGQPRAGRISPAEDRPARRQGLQRISLARVSARKPARHRPRLLIRAERPNAIQQPAQSFGVVPVLFCRIACRPSSPNTGATWMPGCAPLSTTS